SAGSQSHLAHALSRTWLGAEAYFSFLTSPITANLMARFGKSFWQRAILSNFHVKNFRTFM
ncbi:MAG TPA: hypothetical protein VGL94_11635, partial [Ktedonobacteraceae bacterium]